MPTSRHSSERQIGEILATFDAEVLEPEVRHVRCTGYVDSDELAVALDMYRQMPLSSRRNGWLLDVGCGQGGYGQEIASKVLCTHIGIDVVFETVQLVRSQLIATDSSWSMLAVCGDLLQLPFRDGAISGLLIVDVLHFVSQRSIAASEFYRVSKRGAPVLATLCTPSDTDGTEWACSFKSAGYAMVTVEDTSRKWNAWLRRKHEARLDQRDRLTELIGARNTAAVLEISLKLLHGGVDVPRIDQMRRFLIKATK